MKNRNAAAAALTLTAVLALSACTTANADGMSGMHHDKAPTAPANGKGSPADVMFLTMMIPHHQQAVEMSDALLAKSGVDPDVAELAEKIKAAQSPEIEKMHSWLKGWGIDDSTDDTAHDMGGMMSENDMKALEDASGPAASELFLTQMIKHHEGALTMAKAEIAKGRDAESVALAKAIVEDQRAEIAHMEQMLGH